MFHDLCLIPKISKSIGYLPKGPISMFWKPSLPKRFCFPCPRLSKCQELLCNGFSVEDSSKKKDKLGPMVLVPSPSATIILDGTEA